VAVSILAPAAQPMARPAEREDTMRRAPGQRAFPLLGGDGCDRDPRLGLTDLGSQVGLFTNDSRGEHLTVATNLARCKWAARGQVITLGYQITDEPTKAVLFGRRPSNEGYH